MVQKNIMMANDGIMMATAKSYSGTTARAYTFHQSAESGTTTSNVGHPACLSACTLDPLSPSARHSMQRCLAHLRRGRPCGTDVKDALASGVTRAAAGWDHCVVLCADGRAWAAGWNTHGQATGDEGLRSVARLRPVAGLSSVTIAEVAAGETPIPWHSLHAAPLPITSISKHDIPRQCTFRAPLPRPYDRA